VILPGPRLPPLALWLVGLVAVGGFLVYLAVRRRRQAD
jgi:hypothetical protein